MTAGTKGFNPRSPHGDEEDNAFERRENDDH